MSNFAAHIAATRFGTGRSPNAPDPSSVENMLAALSDPDHLARAYPIPPLSEVAPQAQAIRALERAAKKGTKADRAEAQDKVKDFVDQERAQATASLGAVLARALAAEDGFRDRLTWFWSDHFAVEGRGRYLRQRADTFADEAVRPHVAGRFSDMLRAAALHPVMIQFLDQTFSIGPNSPAAQRAANSERGLNENLAREILELHTMGVQGGYSQADVREFAELLAGVGLNGRMETRFLRQRAEPGRESLLGFTSKDDPGSLRDVERFLDRLAVHPDTAKYIATKLVVHFISDRPDPDLVSSVTCRFVETEGDLLQVYAAMLTHPAAWTSGQAKVKRPVEFVVSTLRALDVPVARVMEIASDRPGMFNRWFRDPMDRMGQRWTRPGGPDGWPETPEAWITPSTLAERMRWVLRLQDLPRLNVAEPETVLDRALGPLAHSRLRLAVDGAETREEAITLALMSPEFQRR